MSARLMSLLKKEFDAMAEFVDAGLPCAGVTRFRTPPALTAAALDDYAASYGASVLDLDKALAAAPGPADLIDLTHGDTRAFVPPAVAAADFGSAPRPAARSASRRS
jgi:hypothetical protein